MSQEADIVEELAVSPLQMRFPPNPATDEEDVDLSTLSDNVVAALRTVHDPEIPVNIYDLGLIYRIELQDRGSIEIDMTLTAPGCPVAGEMLSWARKAVSDVEGISNVKVNLVFDPPWDKSKMSEDAKLELGFV
jgi:FeS assembly SUF system protein